MEKKEVRVKCSGCGKSFKLRVPVTSEPVRFKCPECGKNLKLRIAVTPTARPAAGPSAETGFGPAAGVSGVHQAAPGPGAGPTPGAAGGQTPSRGRPGAMHDSTRRWVYMADDMVQGPFTDEEMQAVIRQGLVRPDTPIRRGERPWVKAGRIGIFQPHFPETRPERPVEEEAPAAPPPRPAAKPFQEEMGRIVLYPLQGGFQLSMAVFAGIAVVASIVLCLNFTVGLVLNIVLWTLLYGYLATLMHRSMQSPDEPPPDWNFAQAQSMAMKGIQILAILVLFSLVPSSIFLLLMIYFFLNGMVTFGYAAMLLVVVLFSLSMLVIPAALSILAVSENLSAALNPKEIIAVIKSSGKPYFFIAGLSLAVGGLCFLATLLTVFLTDIPVVGFVVAGLILGVVLSYGHFVWFHAVGRFVGEKEGLVEPSEAPA